MPTATALTPVNASSKAASSNASAPPRSGIGDRVHSTTSVEIAASIDLGTHSEHSPAPERSAASPIAASLTAPTYFSQPPTIAHLP